MENDVTRVPLSKATRDEILKPLKQGDETYDDVIRRLAANGDDPTACDIDEDRIIEALRQEVRDVLRETVANMGGAR